LFALNIVNKHAHQIGRTLDIETPFRCSYYNCRSRSLRNGNLSISVHTNEAISTLPVGKQVQVPTARSIQAVNVIRWTRAVDVIPLILINPMAKRTPSGTMIHVSVHLRKLCMNQFGEFYRDENHESYFVNMTDAVTHVERVIKDLETEGEMPSHAS